MKLGAGQVNVFGFSAVMSGITFAVQLGIFLIAKYAMNIDALQGLDSRGIKLAVITGLSLVAINLFYFFALKHGSAIASQVMWTVGGTVALVIVFALFFGEALTPAKILGIALGLVSVVLITKQS
jgi:drug/metabolite transporter (DMT)-like permease